MIVYSAKQIKKYQSGKQVAYEFLVLRDGEPIIIGEYDKPVLDENGKLIADFENNSWVTEKVQTPAVIKLLVDDGTGEQAIKASLKRQLLEFQIKDEAMQADHSKFPDIGEVGI